MLRLSASRHGDEVTIAVRPPQSFWSKQLALTFVAATLLHSTLWLSVTIKQPKFDITPPLVAIQASAQLRSIETANQDYQELLQLLGDTLPFDEIPHR